MNKSQIRIFCQYYSIKFKVKYTKLGPEYSTLSTNYILDREQKII